MAPRYERSGSGLEFDRVAFFTDAIFAIAMTLLIVDVGIPSLSDGSDTDVLARALDENLGAFVAFFIGFFILGGYWLAHHRMYTTLGSVDGPYVALNLLYLAFVAFLPFSTGLLGEYIDNPLAVSVFAANAAVVSSMEVVNFRYSWRNGLRRDELPAPVFRWFAALQALPVGLFLVSIPVAFVSTWAAIVVWFLAWPVQVAMDRFRPAEADDFD